MARKCVAMGFVGTTLDMGKADNRWQRWRPTVALCQHEDFLVDRLELIHDRRALGLAEQLRGDIARSLTPETEVHLNTMELKDPGISRRSTARCTISLPAIPSIRRTRTITSSITTGTHVAQICWFLLIEAHYIPAKILQLTPPRHSEAPSPGRYGVIDIDLSRYDRIATRFKAEQAEAASFLKSGIATRNPAFNEMIGRIEQVAIRSKAPLLLTGPTGAGKFAARAPHLRAEEDRRQVEGPFVEVNCATLRGDSAMSALFGHRKGAFTGAMQDRPGLLRAANGGVLFLDEIGELGADEQAMILRAIEDKRFLPVGADQEVTSDFQLIAGTNHDLAAAIEQGRFRDDLYARLNLWSFALPGLKERREDIEPNLDFELKRFATREGVHVTFNREAGSAISRSPCTEAVMALEFPRPWRLAERGWRHWRPPGADQRGGSLRGNRPPAPAMAARRRYQGRHPRIAPQQRTACRPGPVRPRCSTRRSRAPLPQARNAERRRARTVRGIPGQQNFRQRRRPLAQISGPLWLGLDSDFRREIRTAAGTRGPEVRTRLPRARRPTSGR